MLAPRPEADTSTSATAAAAAPLGRRHGPRWLRGRPARRSSIRPASALPDAQVVRWRESLPRVLNRRRISRAGKDWELASGVNNSPLLSSLWVSGRSARVCLGRRLPRIGAPRVRARSRRPAGRRSRGRGGPSRTLCVSPATPSHCAFVARRTHARRRREAGNKRVGNGRPREREGTRPPGTVGRGRGSTDSPPAATDPGFDLMNS